MVTRITAWVIQANDTVIIDTPERCECWIARGGVPHALMLSCPLDKRNDLERAVADIKNLEDANGKEGEETGGV